MAGRYWKYLILSKLASVLSFFWCLMPGKKTVKDLDKFRYPLE